MPVPYHPRRYPMWMLALLPLGALMFGHGLANLAAPTASRIVLGPGRTHTDFSVSTRIVAKKVRGKLVHVEDKVYVHVPLVVVHVDHRTIRVPAHRLPLRSGSALVANPLVTVYVDVPGPTVFVPTTFTTTATSVSTETITIPTTITLPLTWTTDPSPTE